MRFQKGSQILIPAGDGIGHYPGERDLRFPETFDHLAGLLAFRLKAHRVGNPCLSAPFGIPDPSQGQIQFRVLRGCGLSGWRKRGTPRAFQFSRWPVVPQCCRATPADLLLRLRATRARRSPGPRADHPGALGCRH